MVSNDATDVTLEPETPISMLALENDVSLMLRPDSLVVSDIQSNALNIKNIYNCFNFCPSSENLHVIPLYNILWAETSNSNLHIYYARLVSKKVVRPATLTYPTNSQSLTIVNQWIEKLLDLAYGYSQSSKRVKVLVNPRSGRGGAKKIYERDVEPLLKAANCFIDAVQTTHRGQAVELSKNLDIADFDVVACCSGDGLPHEVFNGLGKRLDAKTALSKIAVVQIPCGSGNAMSCNLNGSDSVSLATLAIIKGIPTPLDLISITQGETRTLSFLSQSLGIVAESDLATEHLRFLGAHRFTYGFLSRLLTKTVYPCDIAIKVAMDDKTSIKEHFNGVNCNAESVDKGRASILNCEAEDNEPVTAGDKSCLPPLKYGTMNDNLPEGWELVPYNKLGNFYCGNMAYMTSGANFFSASLPSDGFMDLVCINGDISRRLAVKMMLAVEKDAFFDMPGVWYRKILGYRIIPKDQLDGYISIDGERMPFAPFQAEVHKGLGRVLSRSGNVYESPRPI
ncbi:hypothetical protein K3495_g5485 [Podosphaera aphanis]|nr:hypothetical protein K3495_g5485 [Podosphaera aphanis]